MKMTKKNKVIMLALCGTLTCGVGGAYALYSGATQETINTFTIKAGKSNETDESKVGSIIEDKWNPDNAENLSPNQLVEKNPQFSSNAEYEAWVIMQVEIPTVAMKIDNDTDYLTHDAVILEGIDTKNWKKLGEKVSSSVGTNSVYYYGYQKKVNKGDVTSELFTGIRVPDIVDLVSNFTDSVDISAAIIQAEGYADIDAAFRGLGL